MVIIYNNRLLVTYIYREREGERERERERAGERERQWERGRLIERQRDRDIDFSWFLRFYVTLVAMI